MRKFRTTLPALLLASSGIVAPHQLMAQDVAQQPAAVLQFEEVISQGLYIPDVMRETSAVSSVLTLKDLQRAGDSNAASALTRLSGISLMSSRFVYVRGLGERYSSALLNGSPLPSPEPLQRVVPLDLFPANILSGMVVQKTFSASMPGEFGGGVVSLSTVGVPDAPFFNAGISFGGNSRTLGKRGLTYYGSSLDRIGFDSGNRDVPDLVQAAHDAKKRISEANFTDVELQRIGRSFVNAPLNLLQRQKSSPDWGFSFTGGDTYDLGWGRLGFIAVGSFESEWRTRIGIQQEGLLVGNNLQVSSDYGFESNQNDIVMSGLGALALEWTGHKLQWNNFVVRSVQKEARIRAGRDELAGADVRDDYTEFFERELINSQLTGQHQWDAFGVDWRAAYARTTRDAPYEKGIRYRLVNGEYRHNASQEQNYTRFSELGDTIHSAGADFTYAVPLSSAREAVFGAGFAWSDNKRKAESREFRFLALNQSLPLDVQTERVDFLLSDFNIDPNRLVVRETTGAEGAAAYDGRLEVQGGYFQVDAEILPFVRIATGVRIEEATQSVTTLDLFGGPAPLSPVPLQETYVLPTGTVTWNFAEDWQFRVGASQTIARPQFRELAPQQYLDPDSDRLFVGNPFLVDSELMNIDARVERYFDFGDFVTAGFFYKDIDRPVESVVNEAGATIQQTYINAPKSRLWGMEFEGRKTFDFGFTNPYLANKIWLLQANYTYSNSEVIVGAGDVVFPLSAAGQSRPALEYVRNGSRMQGQSDHLANLQFGFEDEVSRTQATFLVTWASDRITARGRPGQPDLIQSPGINLDFNLRQGIKLGGEDFTVGFSARNLLDTDFEEFQKLGTDVIYNNKYAVGANISFSLSKAF
jgi:outer membrane receptor protein involved in Fe transport